MQVVLVAQQFGHLRLAPFGDQPRHGKPPVDQRDNIVALDMDFAVDDQRRDQPARIDAEIPFAQILSPRQVDRMRLPVDALQVEDDPGLLGTGRAVKVEQVHALPSKHVARADIGLQEPNHCTSFPVRLGRHTARRLARPRHHSVARPGPTTGRRRLPSAAFRIVGDATGSRAGPAAGSRKLPGDFQAAGTPSIDLPVAAAAAPAAMWAGPSWAENRQIGTWTFDRRRLAHRRHGP